MSSIKRVVLRLTKSETDNGKLRERNNNPQPRSKGNS